MKIENPAGLSIEFLENGSVRSVNAEPVRISLREATIFSGSAANIWLRKRGGPVIFRPLTGPGSNSRFRVGKDFYLARGSWDDIDYSCCLRLSSKSLSWEWNTELLNKGQENCELDLIYIQDVGIKALMSGTVNEYYVSQYIERRIIDDRAFGPVIFCRQNMREAGGHPWLMVASRNGAKSASTDGMQFYGRTFRGTGVPEGLLADRLGGEYAGESSVVALQETPFVLHAGEKHRSSFLATFLHNHPPATSEADLDRLPGLVHEFSHEPVTEEKGNSVVSAVNLFNKAALLQADDLDDRELERLFGSERRHCEFHNGRLLSFFYGDACHVMLRSKESLTDRPHGHIMQTGTGLVPDEAIMSTTAFAYGVFNSHLTQGNTNFNSLLSVCNSQFNLSPETGQRIFVDIEGQYRLLGVPSAFETGLNHCRWIYRYGTDIYQVRTWSSKRSHQVNTDFRVIRGKAKRILITHHFDELNGWKIRSGKSRGEFIAIPAPESMVVSKFPQAHFIITVQFAGAEYRAFGGALPAGTGYRSFPDEMPGNLLWDHESDLFVLEVSETTGICTSFTGAICASAEPVLFADADKQWPSDRSDMLNAWRDMSRALSFKGDHHDVKAISEILPWYGMNALTHCLTPYGLEQFSGAAWGTRDVSQGPLELLLSMQKYPEAREILRIIFSNQDPDGGWPQWWMFDSYSEIRADSAHGDIMYWCLIALSRYIKATGDMDILEQKLPYRNTGSSANMILESLGDHIKRLVSKVIDSFVPGTALVRYGGGDWNDSLQPVNGDLAARMISAWTVEMNYQAFLQYAEVCDRNGDSHQAQELKHYCDRIKADFNAFLVKDGVVAGYGLAGENGEITLLLHPSDTGSGIKYSILPMERGILSGLFDAVQAETHMDLIEQHLKGPDGARLMDRPLRYSGGIQKLFQRAESSTFFGREIGLMYVHEHIRYAEALARMGRAEAFLKALRQSIPVGYREIVTCGDIRQSNCYYSSSDVIFANRYEADRLYTSVLDGNMPLRGGWRVYSSGPGIFIGIIVSHLLGLRVEWGRVIIDPVIPGCLDGLTVTMIFMEHEVTFNYKVAENTCGPRALSINGRKVSFGYESNPYRRGGAVMPAAAFLSMLDKHGNMVDVHL